MSEAFTDNEPVMLINGDVLDIFDVSKFPYLKQLEKDMPGFLSDEEIANCWAHSALVLRKERDAIRDNAIAFSDLILLYGYIKIPSVVAIKTLL